MDIINFLLNIGFKVRPVSEDIYAVFSSKEKIEGRMKKVREVFPYAYYKRIPSDKSCYGDYYINLHTISFKNYYDFLNATKDLDIIVYENHISVWCGRGDSERFFKWIRQSTFGGFDYVNNKCGEVYWICFKCDGCFEAFCENNL